MIKEVEDALIRLYSLEPRSSVVDFLCDLSTAEQALESKLDRREALIISESADTTEVGLYLADAIVETATHHAELWEASQHCTNDHFFALLEGISHFLYFMYRAEQEGQVSQLELELQAEVDKYAAPLLEGLGIGAIRERSRKLRTTLFQSVEFIDDRETEAGQRYRAAHKFAEAYTRHLEERFVRDGNVPALIDELRRFYREGLRSKLERIPM